MSGRMVTISAGTPPYIPLEQSQGRKADPSFDVYSFGVTLYEVVSGSTPFVWKHATSPGGRTAQIDAFMAWLQSDDAVPPAMPKDPELSGIIARAMAQEPDASVHRRRAGPRAQAVPDRRPRVLASLLAHRPARAVGAPHRAATVARCSRSSRSPSRGVLVWAQLQRQAKEEAELRAVAAAAQADASEKERLADEASRDAEAANARAEQAEREGKDARRSRPKPTRSAAPPRRRARKPNPPRRRRRAPPTRR